ncbi:MAG: restriction endonuclease [Chloroflexota bacterium]
MSILTEWEITPQQLTDLLEENPSLRGMLLGYVAELKLKEIVTSIPNVSYTVKFDDHNRKKKGDLYIIYRERAFDLESKSLQSSMIKWDENKKRWTGKAQVDGSDRRTITLPDGSTLNTTLLLRGDFDILAVNCYAFEGKWRFVFARNSDLPSSSYRLYSEEQRKFLIASLIPVSWPPEPPFYSNLRELLDEMINNGEGTDPSDLDSK